MPLVPENAEPALDRALARDARRRLRGLSRRTRALLDRVPRRERTRFFASGAVRSWIAAVEEATAILDTRDRSRLVDLVADLGALAALAPTGRIPRDFVRRAHAFARAHLERQEAEAPLLVLPWLPREARRGRFRVPLVPDLDLGRPEGELEMPAVPLRFVASARTLRLSAGAESLRVGEARVPFPEASRETPPPAVGAVLLARGVAVEVGPRDPGFERRVRRALDLLGTIWPEAAALVRRTAWRIVPVTDWATVSYSSPRRPGVAYVHVRSAPLVRLAEDLLHETVHMRLHAIETARPLVHRAGRVREGDSEGPRFWSPWRREWRPVRGLLHGACTFMVGAAFFERAIAAPVRWPSSRRRWLVKRRDEELENVRVSLEALGGTEARPLLTEAGRAFVSEVRAEHRRLAKARRDTRGRSRASERSREGGR